MPEVGDDFRSWTIRIRPGIYFADDPAFSKTSFIQAKSLKVGVELEPLLFSKKLLRMDL